MRVAIITGFIALVLGSACVGQSPPARAQEAATDFNTNQRFGRMELVAERVADATRDKFFERRKLWGNKIQVADTEILGFKMKGDTEAEVMLKISWYRVDEGDLHITVVKQSWKDMKGAWKVVNEERADGDVGLLADGDAPRIATGGEGSVGGAAPAGAPTERRLAEKRRFATVRLGQPESPSTDEPEDESLPELAEAPAPAPAAAKSADTKPAPASAAPVPSTLPPAAPANTKAEPPKSDAASAESARRPASGTP